jgi:dihydrofolate synthase / folylpolyglutamate synthase
MQYNQAVAYLFGLERFGWQLGLDRMEALLAEMGNPHRRFRSIHVAGTNGKGSVCAMMESMLRSAGLVTGMYTSPHLIKVEERIRISGVEMAEHDFTRMVSDLQPLIDKHQSTFFEAVTAMAFSHFDRQQVDIAVIEVGLGGRLDATNVLHPLVSIITHIDYDHTEHLGRSLAEIAAEKAGIIKPGVPCVVGKMAAAADYVIRQKGAVIPARTSARIHNLQMTDGGSVFEMTTPGKTYQFTLALAGPHQVLNSCVAVQAVRMCEIKDSAIVKGLQQVQWPGRFQRLCEEPIVIADVAHNVSSFRRLCWMIDYFFPEKNVIMVIGVLKDKDYEQMMRRLPKRLKEINAVPPSTNRALSADRLAESLNGRSVQAFANVTEGVLSAWKNARKNDLICIAGSHYVVGEAMQQIKLLTK